MQWHVHLTLRVTALGNDLPVGQSIEQRDEELRRIIYVVGGLQGRPHRTPQRKKQDTLGFHTVAEPHHRGFGLHDRHEVALIFLTKLLDSDHDPISCADCAYNLHGDDRKNYDQTLLVLMQVVKFWPPVPSLQMAARKWSTVAILDMIAVEHGWLRPKTTVLTPGCEIPPGTVLKRSHSECGLSVILPEEAVRGTGGVASRECRMRKALRTWDQLNARTTAPLQKWASQEYVDTLTMFGEWRCFIVGGHVINVVHTIKEDNCDLWHGERVWQFLSLAEIRYVPNAYHGWHSLERLPCRQLWHNRHNAPVTAEMLVNPQTGDRRSRSDGWEELRLFIDTTYRGLVTQESNPLGLRSSLTVFCRMDIGLMFDGEGNPSYFVTDIERSATMSMWLKVIEDTTNRSMLDTFARVLHTHVTQLNDFYTY